MSPGEELEGGPEVCLTRVEVANVVGEEGGEPFLALGAELGDEQRKVPADYCSRVAGLRHPGQLGGSGVFDLDAMKAAIEEALYFGG